MCTAAAPASRTKQRHDTSLTYSCEERARLIAKACTRPSDTPAGQRRERWTYEELAAEVGMSSSHAHTILARADIKPHRSDYWVMSDFEDPEFEQRLKAVCGLYVDPPENVLVVSIDEKTGIQAKAPTKPDTPAAPGKAPRREHEYTRNGTQCLFACLNIKEGDVLGMASKTRNRHDLIRFLDRCVLMASEGLWSNGEIAEALGVSRPTVTKWRNRFAQRRFEGLADEPRPGKPRTITDEQVEAVVTKTLESTPKNATHWSTRSMAREMGMTPDAVMRIWHAFGLAPHRQETWKLSKDPLFIEKVHDICGLYLNPPERAVVLCVDEKSQIQALDRTAPTLPMLPGTPERATHDPSIDTGRLCGAKV